MKLFNGFLITASTQTISIFADMITRVIMARTMGPSLYGGFGIGLSAVTSISKIFAFGAIPSIQYYGSKKEYKQEDYLRTCVLITVTISAIILIVALGVVPKLLSSYWDKQEIGFQTYTVMTLFIPIIVIGNMLSIVLIPWNRVGQYGIIILIGGVLMPIIYGLCIISFLPLNAAIISQCTIWIIIFIYNIWLFRITLKSGSLCLSLASKIIVYGIKTWPNVILNIGVARIAVLLGAKYLASSSMGYFLVAINVAEGIFLFHAGLGQLILSKVSEQESDSFEIIQRITRISFTIFIVLAVLYILYGKYIFTMFFGKLYDHSYGMSIVLLIVGISHTIRRVLTNLFAGMGMPGQNTLILSMEVSCLIGLIPWLTIKLGDYGLAWAVAISALLTLIFASIRAMSVMKCTLFDLYIVKKTDLILLLKNIKSLLHFDNSNRTTS